MTDQAALERILALLNDAMLDDAHWPAASALIDEACGLSGNALMVGDGPKEAVRVGFVGLYQRGQRREEFEREYLELYHPIDERVPRVRQLPECRLVHTKDLYTDEEKKTSPVYNDLFRRARYQDSLAVRLDGMDGSHMSLGLGDPVDRQGWGSSRIALIERLLPHIRQFVRVRQVLGRARAYETTATGLLENRRLGIIHLDQSGLILAANDRARQFLLRQDGLADRDGELCALAPADQPHLQRLVAAALPVGGAAPVSGSMPLRRANGVPPLVVHVKPVSALQPDYPAHRGAGPVGRTRTPAPCRSRPGGRNPGSDRGGEPGGGLAGGRQACERHGPGRGPHQAGHLLAPAPDLPETPRLPAGGYRPARAVGH